MWDAPDSCGSQSSEDTRKQFCLFFTSYTPNYFDVYGMIAIIATPTVAIISSFSRNEAFTKRLLQPISLNFKFLVKLRVWKTQRKLQGKL